MKVHPVVLLSMLMTLGCQLSQTQTAVLDTYTPSNTASELTSKLKAIYQIVDGMERTDSFDRFFARWNKSIPPCEEPFINQDDTLNAVFQVFEVLYKPFDLLALGKWEWGNELNANAKYAAIQNKIDYMISTTDDLNGATGVTHSIGSFRPHTVLDPRRVLYLTKEFSEALYSFLGTEETAMGVGNIMNPSRPAGESQNRYRILRQYVPILHGHNSGWNIATSPTVTSMTFNRSLTSAIVQFTVGYEGGEATLKKVGEEWAIVSSEATWIQ